MEMKNHVIIREHVNLFFHRQFRVDIKVKSTFKLLLQYFALISHHCFVLNLSNKILGINVLTDFEIFSNLLFDEVDFFLGNCSVLSLTVFYAQSALLDNEIDFLRLSLVNFVEYF
jgi:hypothetical protein